ncbi:MAG: DNA-3-methyladenine glycosylase [Bacteroidales bacterium]|nr:DNA-3-methyladenine glycosylase [Bacteroidales bacterium]
MLLPARFYQQPDVVKTARELLGKGLLTYIEGQITGGIITETEAYKGISDKASHAYNNLRTRRTETMYKKGGITYVYLCYGMHHMLNIVTHEAGIPDAILIRGFIPCIGLRAMEARTGYIIGGNLPVNGPGRVTKCLGISRLHNELSLRGNIIWLEDWGIGNDLLEVCATARIGIDYAEEDAALPYRFVAKFTKTKNPG